jgi:acetolactate synthase I/II/III large subunit
MKASDYIADFLEAQGVTHVFEVIGGMTTHLIDSLSRRGKIKIVTMHHEQAAAFAAEAFARISGVPGVAMATSGPGAINLLTGIGSCYFDSTPAVFLTGQVNRHELKGSRPIRQLGFQETDIVPMALPVTKAAWQVQSAELLPSLLTNAFELALSERPGPVLIDIPMDVQRSEVDGVIPRQVSPDNPRKPSDRTITNLLEALSCARRPLILAGGGLRSAGAVETFRLFLDRLRVPVVNSLMGVDSLPFDHPLRIGLIGTYGNRWANLATGKSDFLLVLGSRLDVRQTGSDTTAFKSNRTIYHVDCDEGETNNRVQGCQVILSGLRSFLEDASSLSAALSFPDWAQWLAEIDELRVKWPDDEELKGLTGINPNELLHQLSRHSHSAAAYVVDVGQNQMWAAQSLELRPEQRFLTSGGMGAMGFALPAAIGASIANTRQPIVVIAGDGGFQMNLQELQTVARERVPLKMLVLNNHCLGMVRQFQQSYFNAHYQSTYWGYSAPDFSSIAAAYGIDSKRIERPEEVAHALKDMWRKPTEPYLLEVRIDTYAEVCPKVAFGRPITEMEPAPNKVTVNKKGNAEHAPHKASG